MAEIDLSLLLLAAPAMVAAAFIHGALGLGFPMVATPLIAIFVDVKVAIILTLIPTATVNLASIFKQEKIAATVSKYQVFVLVAAIGCLAGSVLLATIDAGPFRLLLALLIISFLLTSHYDIRLNIKPTTSMMVLFGLIAGIAGGTTNVMVAVLIIYFLSVKVERSEMVLAMNLCFLVGKLTQIAVFMVLGLVNLIMLIYTVPLALLSFAALRVGQFYSTRIDAEKYNKILKIILLFLAGILVVQFFNEL